MKPVVLIILLVLFFIVRSGSGYASNKLKYPSLSCDCSKNEIDILQMKAYWDVVDANEYDYIMNITNEDSQFQLLQIFADYARRRLAYDTLMNQVTSTQGMIQLTMNNYKMAKSYYKMTGDPTNGGALTVLNDVNPPKKIINDVTQYYPDITDEDQKTFDSKMTAYTNYINTL
jgi:hypothetical protein